MQFRHAAKGPLATPPHPPRCAWSVQSPSPASLKPKCAWKVFVKLAATTVCCGAKSSSTRPSSPRRSGPSPPAERQALVYRKKERKEKKRNNFTNHSMHSHASVICRFLLTPHPPIIPLPLEGFKWAEAQRFESVNTNLRPQPPPQKKYGGIAR